VGTARLGAAVASAFDGGRDWRRYWQKCQFLKHGAYVKKSRGVSMPKIGVALVAVCAMLTMGICVAQDLVNIVLGTIEKADSTAKTIVVKTADGTEHTIRVTDAATLKGTKEGFNGLREGSQIVARTTGTGAGETATEVGKISEDGFKATDGTVEKFEKDTKRIVVKNVHGAKKTFELGGKALEDAGQAKGGGIIKGTIVTVYYTEEGGEKVAYYVSN
jgi:hypothetical protein